MNLNVDSKKENTFDAIVIGSGISGGWAAKELSEKGLKTLVLERGRDVKHNVDYPTTNLKPWEFPHYNQLPTDLQKENPIVSKCYAFHEDAQHFFVKDKEHPYVQEKPFDWIRGYQVGGKSLLWARQTQRWSDHDFTGPARDGFAVDWPIRYSDLAPWYSYVETFAGISGNKDGLSELPDGEFLPPMEMTKVESYFKEKVAAQYKNRHVIIGRCAHITEVKPIYTEQGRVKCQHRDLCQRGCPYGGYFSSNASTIPWAQKTGNLTIRPDSVVHSILYDEKTGRASGVRIIDAHTHAVSEFSSRIVFVNASALNTNLILLNSTSSRFPHGLGNDSGVLGKYVCHHNYRTGANGKMPGFEDQYFFGRNPTECILANFRNLGKQDTDFVGGYTTFTGAYRSQPEPADRVGGAYKDTLAQPGPWGSTRYMQAETTRKGSTRGGPQETKRDQWGSPLLATWVKNGDKDDGISADCRRGGKAMP